MPLELDENLPQELAEHLRGLGHDAHTCHDEHPQGAADPVVSDTAKREQRVLVTFDLDFSDMRRYPPGAHPGIIALRLRDQDVDNVVGAMSRVLAQIPIDDLLANIVIVEESRVRIRRSTTQP